MRSSVIPATGQARKRNTRHHADREPDCQNFLERIATRTHPNTVSAETRHTFAVSTLIDWYRAGADIAANMPLLSRFMGHVGPASTFYYLHAEPELLGLAAQRLDDHQQSRTRREAS
jgi:hypothetical protein